MDQQKIAKQKFRWSIIKIDSCIFRKESSTLNRLTLSFDTTQ